MGHSIVFLALTLSLHQAFAYDMNWDTLPGHHLFLVDHGAIRRGDSTSKKIAIVFTGDEYGEGGSAIMAALQKENVKASFFFTGRFYRNLLFKELIRGLKEKGHYLGAHSNEHLLYCDWVKRDSLLVTKKQFNDDLDKNYMELRKLGITSSDARYFLPPYEWYNDSIALWTRERGLQLISFSPGTLSSADYTTTQDNNYRSSEIIYTSILNLEARQASGLNGFILLMHIGAGPGRTDKFYKRLPQLVKWLRKRGYEPVRIDQLLDHTGKSTLKGNDQKLTH
jgi:peptidoglycan/xylan/chitin deacetylase (PgdA/CDA1 family)